MLGTPQPIIDRITNHVTGRGMSRVYNMYDYRDEKLAAIQRWADHVEGGYRECLSWRTSACKQVIYANERKALVAQMWESNKGTLDEER